MTIEERLEQVESTLVRVKRQNRGLLFVILLTATAWVVFAESRGYADPRIEGQKRDPEKVYAQGFVLVDLVGRTRATLGMTKGPPALTLYDEKGKPRVLLETSEGPKLYLFDEKHTMPRLTLRVEKNCSAMFVHSGEAATSIALGAFHDRPTLGMRDEGDILRVILGMFDGPRLELRDAEGKPIWSAPVPFGNIEE